MVKVLQGISKNKITKKSILAIGNFDGFHIGHRSIIKAGKQIAKKIKRNLEFLLLILFLTSILQKTITTN